MNKKMIMEYLKTIVFAIIMSVGISLLLCYLVFVVGQEDDKSKPQYWIRSIGNYISCTDGKFTVDSTALSMLREYNSWIEILDENGVIVYSKYVPENFSMNLSNLNLINNLLGKNNVPGYTLYAMDLSDYPGYGVLIGCDSSIVSKYSITIAGSGTLLVLKCALVFLITTVLVIIGASYFYSKKITAPVTRVITDIENISLRKDIEKESNAGLFQNVFLQLQKLQEMLQENENMRNTWVVNISHDIKTPLSTVRGYAELLSSENYEIEKSEVQNFALEILKSEKIIEGLVDDLSISHRLAEGNMILQKTDIDIRKLLEESVKDIESYGKSTNHIFLSCEDGYMIEADHKLLKRSLVNIICNAFVHNDHEVSVYVSVQNMGDKLLVVVEDSGAGVEEKELAYLFDRYYRGTNTSNTQGTGLGLAIAKEVLRAHEGMIQVMRSTYGGLKFELTMKRKL